MTIRVPSKSLFVGISGITLLDWEQKQLKHPAVGGVILFSRNYESPEQLRNLCREIRLLKPELVIAVDQEGGRVQRFRDGFYPLPALKKIGDFRHDMTHARVLAKAHAWVMASEIVAHGCDFSFAPVLDHGQNQSVIGDRAFAQDCCQITSLVGSYLEGLRQAGVISVGKHFPGHGGVAGDSHLELPVDERKLSDLEKTDLTSFQAAISEKLDAVMMAHVLYSEVDAQPAGYSRFWIQSYLRDEMLFKGVVFSDDLDMAGAGQAALSERMQQSLEAGCDFLLVCSPDSVDLALSGLSSDDSKSAPIGKLRKRVSIDPDRLYASAMWSKYTLLLNGME